MTKAELVSEVCEKSNVSKKDAASVIENTFSTITDALAKGDKITLVGFGTFETNERKAHAGRNPKTGMAIQIESSTQVRFKPGAKLKQTVNS